MTAPEDMNQRQRLEPAVADQGPAASHRTQTMAADLVDSSRLDVLVSRTLSSAISLMAADFGNVQLVDPASGALKIVAQYGFSAEFLEYFAVVDDDNSACGRAARNCAQTVIADVTTDPGFEPHREIAAAEGFRAVQSTPLADASGRLIGMVSTHWHRACRPPRWDLAVLRLLGEVAGEAVTRNLRPATRSRPVDLPPDPARGEFADRIVNRLFIAGLSLASAQSISGPGPAEDRIRAAADELDRAIGDIRMYAFTPGPASADGGSR